MGVDVMRWLYANQKPEADLYFGYNRGDEARRQFLIPLWNAYSFFVTYANLDGWTPGGTFDPDYPEGPTPLSSNLLDRWVLARLNQVVARVTTYLDGSDFLSATGILGQFLEDLTNWYIRRSRRRFWKNEHDSDKNEAYATLYHVLVKLARLLAPFTPFVTEAMYQNLVVTAQPEQARQSVHHTRWPQSDQAAVDANMLEQMALARQIASLGLAARSGSNLKVRQPLGKAMAFAGGGKTLLPELVEIVTDELNVKAFEFVEEAGKLVNYRILPDNKLLGPKYGPAFPKIRMALLAMDPAVVTAQVQAGQGVDVQVDGNTFSLLPEEVQVHSVPVEGLAVASDNGVSVAIDATLTPDLKAEGMAREVVRRVQDLRKQSGLDISDRIRLYCTATPLLQSAVDQFKDYIAAETLAVALMQDVAPDEAAKVSDQFDGEKLDIGIIKA